MGLLCLVWGTTWAVIQVGLAGIPPFTGVSIRFALAGTILLVIALARGVPLGRTRREVALWLINGILSFTVSYGVVYWAEQWVPSGLAAVLFATYPLFVAVLAHFFLPAESLVRWEVLGILIGFAGVGVIYSEDFAALGGPEVAVGALVLMLSPVAAAVGSVSVKRWGRDVHAFSVTSVPMLIAAGVMAAMAVGFERDRAIVWDTTSVSALLYLSIVGSAVTFTIYYWLLARLPAKRLALIAYVIPVIAVGIGQLRGEPLTLRMVIGAAGVILGVALAVQRR